MDQVKVQEFYEKESQIYNETRFKSYHGLYSDNLQKIAVFSLLGNCKGKRILEIGSGTGRFTKDLIKRGAKVVCVDISRKMHERNRQRNQGNLPDFYVMSALELGFADGTFDGCITINMMSHIKDNVKVFQEVRRVLKVNGVFVANFPNITSLFLPIGASVNAFKRSVQAPVYSKWYTPKEVMTALKTSQLQPTSTFGRITFPKKYCPKPLFLVLKYLNSNANGESFWSSSFLQSDLYVKSLCCP